MFFVRLNHEFSYGENRDVGTGKSVAVRVEAMLTPESASLEEYDGPQPWSVVSLHPYFCQIGSIVLPIMLQTALAFAAGPSRAVSPLAGTR